MLFFSPLGLLEFSRVFGHYNVTYFPKPIGFSARHFMDVKIESLPNESGGHSRDLLTPASDLRVAGELQTPGDSLFGPGGPKFDQNYENFHKITDSQIQVHLFSIAIVRFHSGLVQFPYMRCTSTTRLPSCGIRRNWTTSSPLLATSGLIA